MKCEICFYNLRKKDRQFPKYLKGKRLCKMCFNRQKEEEKSQRVEEKKIPSKEAYTILDTKRRNNETINQ